MKKYLVVACGEKIIAEKAELADGFLDRFLGLMFRKSLDLNGGLLLKPCRQIHMFFMRFSIDAVFFSKENKIVHLEKNLAPGRMTRYIKDAESVLELNSGTADKCGIAEGDILIFQEVN